MRPCHFAGAALHTSLGADLATNIEALGRAPTPPVTIPVHSGGGDLQLHYRLLAGMPLQDTEARLYTAMHRVIEASLDAANLHAGERRRCGLFIGSSSFDIGVTEARFVRALSQDPDALAMQQSNSIGTLADGLREHFGLAGATMSFSTACTGSANALLYANAMVRSGWLDDALVLGVETFNLVTSLGFSGLQLLSATDMRPFSKGRSGIVLGEGCSALLLSHRQREDSGWQIVAGANRCDTYGMSTANPDGRTIAAVIAQALANAGLRPEQIVAIKTHGTATPSGDEVEAAGMKRIFGRMPPLTALKPFIGHTLGACGLNELLLFCGAVDRGFLVATPGIGADDPEFGFSLNQSPCAIGKGCYLLNYFGFGGNNTSLILSNQPGAQS